MTISIYLMNYILNKFTSKSSQGPASDDFRLKLQIMLSTILWLDELFPNGFAFEDNLLEFATERQKRLAKWVYKSDDVRQAFIQEKLHPEVEKRTRSYAAEAWELFANSSSTPNPDPVVSFAFKLSKTGVLWSFPDVFPKFERREYPDNVSLPDW
jgi:hypothetical protein